MNGRKLSIDAIRTGCPLLLTLLFFALSAAAAPYEIRAIDYRMLVRGIKSRQIVYGLLTGGYPALINPTTLLAEQVGSIPFYVVDSTLAGDLVGYSSQYRDEGRRANVSYFFAERNKETVKLLEAEQENFYRSQVIAMNNDGNIAIPLPDSVKFFNRTNLLDTVIFPTGFRFNSGEGAVLSGGDFVVSLVNYGTPRWVRIKPSGEFTVIESGALPQTAKGIAAAENNRIYFFDEQTQFVGDLINPPTRRNLRSTIGSIKIEPTSNAGGTAIAKAFEPPLLRADNLEYRHFIIRPDGSYLEPTCLFPRNKRIFIKGLSQIADDGTILADISPDNDDPTTDVLLIPTSESHTTRNYCVTTTATVFGSCASAFEGLVQKHPLPRNKECTALVTIRDGRGKRLKDIGVGLTSELPFDDPLSILQKGQGKTNRNGQFVIRFTANGTLYVVAPLRSKALHKNFLRLGLPEPWSSSKLAADTIRSTNQETQQKVHGY